MKPIKSIKSKESLAERPKDFNAFAPPAQMLLTEAVKYWLSLYDHRQFSENTRNTYGYAMKSFLETLPSEVRFITDLRSEHIENHLDELLRKDYAIPTINHYLKVVKIFCRWMQKRYKIPNPAKEIASFKLRRYEKKFLSKEQYLELLKVCDEEFVPWIEFLAATGIRATVFCNLQWNMYDPNNKTICIPAKFAKSKRPRTIGLNKTALSILKNIQQAHTQSPNDLIFTLKNGTPLDRKILYGKINRGFKKLGLTGGPHALRHYCATQLLKAGVPIIKVSKFLGHTDITTTQKHYEHLVVSDFARIADVLDS